MYGRPPSSPQSKTRTMFGCASVAAARASPRYRIGHAALPSAPFILALSTRPCCTINEPPRQARSRNHSDDASRRSPNRSSLGESEKTDQLTLTYYLRSVLSEGIVELTL